MNIAVIGLGLIGGSLAMALKGFEGAAVTGVVRSQSTLEYAVERQVCGRVTLDPMEALPEADVVWLCMQPRAILDFMKAHRDHFKPGATIFRIESLPETVKEVFFETWL